MFNKNELKEKAFCIAEVGQNHQGSFDLAKKYISEFASLGADAIKFQTRDNKYLFADEAYQKNYESENSFAETYGKHREKLELDKEYLPQLLKVCHKNKVKFMSTPFDEPSLDLLIDLKADILKVASFDLGNLPFLAKIAKANIPMVMSVGGGQIEQIKDSVALITKHCDDLAILHCVSEYPCEANRVGLENIEILIKEFPDLTIGLSDHYSGTITGPLGYLKGARVFEKHVTLNRSWKGTDHSFSLSRNGFKSFVKSIRLVPEMLPTKPKTELGDELVFQKLGKSIVANKKIKPGEELTLNNLSGKIFSSIIIPVRESNKVIGKKAVREIKPGEPVTFSNLI